MNTRAWQAWSIYFTKPLLIILVLGFVSGLPLSLTASTLTYWLADANVQISTIGLFAAVATPYTLKFLWAPLMDSLPIPFFTHALGRRRGWILFTQIALMLGLVLLACARPDLNPVATAFAALLVSFLSASQDIVIDAYRVELLPEANQGQGAAMIQLGYRLGMLASSAGALYLAASIGWQGTYVTMAALISIGLAATLIADEPQVVKGWDKAKKFGVWLHDSVISPFADFMARPHWALILLFIVIYKLADAFIGGMTNPFFHALGFAKTDVASIVKIYGTIATLLGTFIGGVITARYGAMRILFVAGLLHGLTNLCFVWQAHAGADTTVLAISITLENLTGGISAAAFVAFLSGLTHVHYTATQYALLSSLAALGRTWLATPAGYAVAAFGWVNFFLFSAALAIPGLVLLVVLQRRLTK